MEGEYYDTLQTSAGESGYVTVRVHFTPLYLISRYSKVLHPILMICHFRGIG